MTNRELINRPREHLSPVERQQQYVLRVELSPMPCPACQQPVDALTAAGLDIDAYQFGKSGREFTCPHCRAELEQVVPVFAVGPGWYWQLDHTWLKGRLHKANLYDQEHPQEEPR